MKPFTIIFTHLSTALLFLFVGVVLGILAADTVFSLEQKYRYWKKGPPTFQFELFPRRRSNPCDSQHQEPHEPPCLFL